MTTIDIHGPNLRGDDARKGDLHVHRAGCQDSKRMAKRYGKPWTIEASTRAEIVMEVYPPEEFGYDEADWREYDDLFIAPCAAELRTEPPA